MVAVFTNSACAKHDMGEGRPEQPARLQAALSALDLLTVQQLESPMASREVLELIHPRGYVDEIFFAVQRANERGENIVLDSDTSVCGESGDAARYAVGGVIAAIDYVMNNELQNNLNSNKAFCISRPPGHHAEPEAAMGFCLFNSIAIGAAYIKEKYDLSKIAVVDFDVHHGNGTEACFLNRPNFMYCSSHQQEIYPHSGAADFKGLHGNILNCPLPANTNSMAFKAVYEEKILPALEAFKPEFILISAGFDGHKDDPLAQWALESEDFEWVTREICNIADKTANGRVVSMLEGGYDLAALKESVFFHLQGLKS